MDIIEIEVKDEKTVNELIAKLQLGSMPILLEVGGQAFYPDEIKDRQLKRGDRVLIIPLVAGG